jgi:hypothetical protein
MDGQQFNKKKKHQMTKEKLDKLKTTMIKMKITILIRVPKEVTAEFSVAEVHIATIRELSKQDANLIVLDHQGINHVNIHKSFVQVHRRSTKIIFNRARNR